MCRLVRCCTHVDRFLHVHAEYYRAGSQLFAGFEAGQLAGFKTGCYLSTVVNWAGWLALKWAGLHIGL